MATPLKGWTKVNIDGLDRGDPSSIACGSIFRDESSYHMGSFCDFMGDGTAVLAELVAAIIAMERTKILGWRKIWMESDCILVVKAFSDFFLVLWKLRSRWLNCVAYTRNIDFMIYHVYREPNFCADFLASIGFSLRCSSWFSFVHSVIVKDYLLDKEGTPKLRICN